MICGIVAFILAIAAKPDIKYMAFLSIVLVLLGILECALIFDSLREIPWLFVVYYLVVSFLLVFSFFSDIRVIERADSLTTSKSVLEVIFWLKGLLVWKIDDWRDFWDPEES
ncbi:MAG: hypothetical protein LKM30_04295 [Bacilli bacterium]|jgi:predicted membrane channel-forming protein YqfA (hemolysin III family)|nr:hypothetical protein [Bacilli bacterium]